MRSANARVHLDNCCQVAWGWRKLRAKGQGTCTGQLCAVKGSVFKLLQRTTGATGGAGLDVEAAKAVVLRRGYEVPQTRGRQRAVTTRNFARVIEARAGGRTHEER